MDDSHQLAPEAAPPCDRDSAVVAAILRIGASLPVILSCAYGRGDTVAKALEAGAADPL